MKTIYHIKQKKYNLCGTKSTNSISGDKKSLEDIEYIIYDSNKFMKLCKRCKKSKVKNEKK
jgi:hypothetical protein